MHGAALLPRSLTRPAHLPRSRLGLKRTLSQTTHSMAGRKTRKTTAEDAGTDRAALEAFYMRVMHRVCRAYRERSGNGDAAALLEQVGRLSCVTDQLTVGFSPLVVIAARVAMDRVHGGLHRRLGRRRNG
jgi:hypothetical protein